MTSMMLLLVILCALVDTLVVNGYSFKKFLNPTHFCKTVAPVVLSSLMTAANVNAVAPPPTFVPAAARESEAREERFPFLEFIGVSESKGNK